MPEIRDKDWWIKLLKSLTPYERESLIDAFTEVSYEDDISGDQQGFFDRINGTPGINP